MRAEFMRKDRGAVLSAWTIGIFLAVVAPPAPATAQHAHGDAVKEEQPALDPGTLMYPGEEKAFAAVKQLTHGGSNAEAYFNWDGSRIIFQQTAGDHPCDLIYSMKADGSDVALVSRGRGRTTCGFFFPDGRLVYASTQHHGPDCPPKPDRSRGYVWKLYDYDVYVQKDTSSEPVCLTSHPEYDAECVLSPDGKTILFTSLREEDLDIYAMDADGGNVRRLTYEKGFDGGAFFSWDGKKIVYRGYHPKDAEEMKNYQDLIAERLLQPFRAEIYLMDADGQNRKQLTSFGQANWCPSFLLDGRIIFSSNMASPEGRNFDLYLLNPDGSGLEQVTFGGFNAFPYFSPDGKRVLFCSDRNAKEPHEFNIFVAEWRGAKE